ncbi:hypothetical protein HMPREF9445_01020 [Bacteroides clarus YIT 12056]|uniref:Uncharacterized protein n=1 Tax=Bacteroides clarus YIT 12056 TaxID=762984 RepID=A0ABN0CQG9_9BACE|nr:hypothetical protein HMPREF9445_01020 [Bacteroides clarus YIT 12056]
MLEDNFNNASKKNNSSIAPNGTVAKINSFLLRETEFSTFYFAFFKS